MAFTSFSIQHSAIRTCSMHLSASWPLAQTCYAAGSPVDMRIALAQLNPTSGDIDGNAAKILAALESARAAGADLVVTPEMALPGYCIGDLIEDEGFLAANERAMRRIADAAQGITGVIGFIDFNAAARNDSGGLRKYNAAAVVRGGQVLQRAHK